MLHLLNTTCLHAGGKTGGASPLLFIAICTERKSIQRALFLAKGVQPVVSCLIQDELVGIARVLDRDFPIPAIAGRRIEVRRGDLSTWR